MRTLSPRQVLDLQLVREADQRWRDARRSLERDIVKELNERVRHLYEARNEAAMLALEAGASKMAISEFGFRTKSTSTARLALAAAQERRRLLAPLPAGPFAVGAEPGLVVVHLDGARLADACQTAGWTVEDAIAAGVDLAEFRIKPTADGRGTAATAATPSFVDAAGKSHPTVAWARAHAADIVAWATAHRVEAPAIM